MKGGSEMVVAVFSLVLGVALSACVGVGKPFPVEQVPNIQICRHSPASRFITLVYAIYEPASGRLTYVNAGQNPPLIRRRDGRFERLHGTGIALGLFEETHYTAAETRLDPGDLLVFYSDGITEAEDPSGQPLEESGLELVLERHDVLTAGCRAAAGPGADGLRGEPESARKTGLAHASL